jgi:hypothetical protein
MHGFRPRLEGLKLLSEDDSAKNSLQRVLDAHRLDFPIKT